MKNFEIPNLIWLPLTAVVAPAYAIDYLTAEEAAQMLFPDAATQQMQLVMLSKENKSAIRALSGMRQRWDSQEVWRAENNGELLGWTIVDEVVGKHEYITYAAGISPDGHVRGIEVLSYRETHGDEIREDSWRENFIGKTLNDEFRLDEDIPNISGATLSCRNVTDGVRRLLAFHQIVLSQ